MLHDYRCWDKSAEVMRPVFGLMTHNKTVITEHGDGETLILSYPDECVLMAAIGVGDVNGRQIFVGDTVTRVKGRARLFSGAVGMVVYDRHRAMYAVRVITGHKWAFEGPNNRTFCWSKDLIVIGNLYEGARKHVS